VPQVIVDTNVGLLVVGLSSLAVRPGPWRRGLGQQVRPARRRARRGPDAELRAAAGARPGAGGHARPLVLTAIVDAQASLPFALTEPVAFALFVIAALAETKRIPFDLPEAENELQAGFHTEYSGMRFALFFVGEYVNMILLGALTAIFFLGGWHGPLLPPILWLGLKVLAVPVFLIWTRASLPRLRYDQLMSLCWKALIPLALQRPRHRRAARLADLRGAMTKPTSFPKAFLDGALGLAGSYAATLRHLFRRPVTEQYPEYKRPLPERTRGRIILTRSPDGRERCVACGCVRAPVRSTASPCRPRRRPRPAQAAWFRINFALCIYCGLCEEACPPHPAHAGIRLCQGRHRRFRVRKGEPARLPRRQASGLRLYRHAGIMARAQGRASRRALRDIKSTSPRGH